MFVHVHHRSLPHIIHARHRSAPQCATVAIDPPSHIMHVCMNLHGCMCMCIRTGLGEGARGEADGEKCGASSGVEVPTNAVVAVSAVPVPAAPAAAVEEFAIIRPSKPLRATNVHVPPCHPICDCCPEESHEFLFEETACVSKGEVSCGLVLFLFAVALRWPRMLHQGLPGMRTNAIR